MQFPKRARLESGVAHASLSRRAFRYAPFAPRRKKKINARRHVTASVVRRLTGESPSKKARLNGWPPLTTSSYSWRSTLRRCRRPFRVAPQGSCHAAPSRPRRAREAVQCGRSEEGFASRQQRATSGKASAASSASRGITSAPPFARHLVSTPMRMLVSFCDRNGMPDEFMPEASSYS
ncbi:hypothetical protein MRX96_046887 [Rhipicephalus microplus]